MNLSALTDLNPKNYLDINCHNILCNSLTANQIINNGSTTSTFSAYSSGTSTISNGTSVSNLCNTFEISSVNFDMPSNVFTAPITGDYEINFGFSVTNTGAAQHINLTYSYANIPVLLSSDFTTTILPQINSFSSSRLVRLNVGANIGYTITSAAGTGNMVISNVIFSGKLIQ